MTAFGADGGPSVGHFLGSLVVFEVGLRADPGVEGAAHQVEDGVRRKRLLGEQRGQLVAVALPEGRRIEADQPGVGGRRLAGSGIRQPPFAEAGHRPHGGELHPQRLFPRSGEPVGNPPLVFGGEQLDQALGFEPRERAVEGARAELDPGCDLDVLGHGVAVLGSAGQADQDQQGGLGKAAEAAQLVAVFGIPGGALDCACCSIGFQATFVIRPHGLV